MKNQFRIFFIIVLALVSLAASGQYYDIGQSPASTKWEKLEAGNFSIIYPSTYYQKAKEAAYLFSVSGKSVAAGLDAKPKLTPIILHTQNAVSNAYSIWAPRRIEVLTTPPQELYAQPWMQQLALHEYRHIVQLSSLNQGFTKFLGYLFGQQAAVVSTGLFVPSWFIEGDAVATETALSYSGRGRVPSFSQSLRAQIDEKGAFSYAKASLGSYRDFVPDVYTLGYHIVAASRQKYGLKIWSEAMKTVAKQPWSITPFNYGLKKKTGLNKKGLYNESLKTLDSLWSSKTLSEVNHIRLSEEPECYTSFQHPYRINDSLIVALKTSLKEVPKIVSINGQGIEKQIHAPGYIMDELISYNGNYLSWAEYRPHIRWETVGFTDIVLLQPENEHTVRLALKGRFFAPVVSPDGTQIAAVGYQESGGCFIALIRDNKLIREIKLSDDLHAAHPVWTNDGKKLVFVATGNQGKALAMISTESGITELITPFSYTEISNPFVYGNEIYFAEAVEGKNQLCKLNIETRKTYQLTNATFGADQVSVSGENLLFADYTSNGYRVALLKLHEQKDLKEKPADTYKWPLAEALSAQETGFRFTDTIPDIEYTRTEYKKAAHLFGIHSWAPVYADIGGETARPGASVMSQNLLSTLFITAGYDYDIDEETGMFRSEIAWKGWFPIIKATMSQGNRASSAILEEGQAPERFTWSETNLDLSISQELNLSKGRLNSGIFGETTYNFSNIVHHNNTPESFYKGILSGLSYRTFGYLYKRRAYRDLAPSLGVNLDLKFRHTPFGDLKAGNILAVQSQIFLPGFFPNHSLQLYAGFQTTNPDQYRFPNIISSSKGYHSEISGNELISLKAAYRLPLFYPDFNIGGLLYIKRFRTGIFHEFTSTSGHTSTTYFNSTGLDLVADLHLFGLSTPISAGARIIYREKYKDFSSSLLFSVNLYEY